MWHTAEPVLVCIRVKALRHFGKSGVFGLSLIDSGFNSQLILNMVGVQSK